MSEALNIITWAIIALYFCLTWQVRNHSLKVKKECLDLIQNNLNITKVMLTLTMKYYVDVEDYEGAQRCKAMIDKIQKMDDEKLSKQKK